MNVCIVSTFYGPGGVSKYTASLAEALKNKRANVIVLSDRPRKYPKNVKDGIVPCWNKGLLYPFQIFKALRKIRGVDIVHIQHEFFLYGNSVHALLFPLLLVMVKLLRKPAVVTLHGVIPLNELNKEFKQDNFIKLPIFLLRIAIIFLTKMIVLLSNAVIVHLTFFKYVLLYHYRCPVQKVHVIPHGINQRLHFISQSQAKERLGLSDKTIIFTFGYLARYKGIETLLAGLSMLGKEENYILIIGGGEHPRLSGNADYRKFIHSLRELARRSAPGRVIFAGFIHDGDLDTYFSAADVVVFSHKYAMSLSGPLALAVGYAKPIVASDIRPFKELIPFEKALYKSGSHVQLVERLKLVLSDINLRHEMSLWSKKLAEKNSWSEVGLQTYKLYQRLCNLSTSRRRTHIT